MAPKDENDILNQNNSEPKNQQGGRTSSGKTTPPGRNDGIFNRFKSSFGSLKDDFNQAMQEISAAESGKSESSEKEPEVKEAAKPPVRQENVRINYEDENSEYTSAQKVINLYDDDGDDDIPPLDEVNFPGYNAGNNSEINSASAGYPEDTSVNRGTPPPSEYSEAANKINQTNQAPPTSSARDENIYSRSQYTPQPQQQAAPQQQETAYVPKSNTARQGGNMGNMGNMGGYAAGNNTGGYYQEAANAGFEEYANNPRGGNSFNMSFIYPQGGNNGQSGDATVIGRNTTVKGEIISGDTVNVLGQLLGDIECKSDVFVSGKVRGNTAAQNVSLVGAEVAGEIKCIDMITVEENSWLLGDIKGSEVLVHGKVKGDIDTRKSISIDTKAVVIGDINTEEIEIKRGAFFNGHIEMYHPSLEVLDRFNEFNDEVG